VRFPASYWGLWITGKNVFHTQRAVGIWLIKENQDASRRLAAR
jgi:hypothetical protein